MLFNLLRKSISFLGFGSQLLLISILMLEVVGLVVFDNRYKWDLRYLFYSNNPIVNEYATSKPFWKYKPDSKIRFAATYSDWFGPKVEYDCIFSTNSFGFTETGFSSDHADLLVLGDSYLEGHGGCPWLTKSVIESDNILGSYRILNGGLQGAGILQFEQTLQYFMQNITVKNIVVVAISNDFKRGSPFTWDVSNECYRSGACGVNDYWFYVPFHADEQELIRISQQRQSVNSVRFYELFLRDSFTYRVYQGYHQIIKTRLSTSQDEEVAAHSDLFSRNFDALDRMRSMFSDVKIILVPQRDEVGLLGVKNLDSKFVERYLDDNFYDYRWCELTTSDYMPVDGHPNAAGYEKLLGCLKEAL